MNNNIDLSNHHSKSAFGSMIAVVLCVAFLMSSVAIADVITFSDNWGAAGFNLLQQDQAGVEINFSVPAMNVTEEIIDGETMQVITIPGAFLPNNAGAPNLPSMGRYIAIPQGAQAQLEIIDSRTEVFHNMNIAPAFEIPVDSDDSPLIYEKDMTIYNVDALFPAQPVTMSDPAKMRGVDVVIVGITPFQYNPVTKDLTVYKDIRIRVSFIGGNGHFGEDRLRSRWWDPVLQQNLINYESLPEVNYNRIRQTDETNVEYLIIVPNSPEFLAWADTLKRWRNEQGIITGITTIPEIGGNNYTLIDNYIVNACTSWAIPPVAVLLLSDYQNSSDLYGITAPVHNYSYYSCVSDNFYADIDNDDLPDLAIGRICAQNNSHLQTMIGKMLTYERQPTTNQTFYRSPVIAGGWQTERWFILCCEVIYGYLHNRHLKTPTREYAIYSGTPGSIWSSNANTWMVVDYFGPDGLGYIPQTPSHLNDWGGNATRLNNDINSGCFIIQHRDHGSVTGWGEPDYDIDDMVGLTNTQYPYVFSINCQTGMFNSSSECFAEAFHRHQYGAVGVMAATYTSYSFVNDVFVWGVYDYMWPNFDPNYGISPLSPIDLKPAFANASGKYYLEASSWPSNPGSKTCTYYLFHHLGDAFMTLGSAMPQQLTVSHNPTIGAGETSFTVTADANSLIGLSHNGAVIGSGDGTGAPLDIAITPLSEGDIMRVTVTLTNHYRYIADVPCASSSPQVPNHVEELMINLMGSHIGLSWAPVTSDTTGNPIDVSYYVVYRTENDPYFVPASGDSIGVVYPPTTNYLDTNALNQQKYFYNVKAIKTN